MAHLFKARQTSEVVTFEVCDAAPGECEHTDPAAHRVYSWAVERGGMEQAQMLREVLLIEGERTRTVQVGTALPEEGTTL